MAAADVRLPAGKLPPDLLQRLLAHHAGGTDPRVLVGPGVGEDAAVLDVGPAAAGDATCLVAKSDPITFATDRIGWYAVHVNANDIAAMGATPRWFLSTVILPQHLASEALVEQILQQIHEACASLGVLVVGGHTEITSGLDRPLVVGHMLGEAAPGQILRSSGLRPGDDVLLTKGVAIEATAILACAGAAGATPTSTPVPPSSPTRGSASSPTPASRGLPEASSLCTTRRRAASPRGCARWRRPPASVSSSTKRG
jgi:hydrogenase expression/formation protein HypE